MKVCKTVKVPAIPKILSINVKCCDMFSFTLYDMDGKVLTEQDDGYVPGFVPNDFGDYLTLEIDVETGRITNWPDVAKFQKELQNYLDDRAT